MRPTLSRVRVMVGVSVGFWLAELAVTVALVDGSLGFAVAGGIVGALAVAWALVERAFSRRAHGREASRGPASAKPEVPRSLMNAVIADLPLRGMLPATVIGYGAFGRESLTPTILLWSAIPVSAVAKQLFARLPPDDADRYRAMLDAKQSGADSDGGLAAGASPKR